MQLSMSSSSHHRSQYIPSSLWRSQGCTGPRRCCCCRNSLAHSSGRRPLTGSGPAAPCSAGDSVAWGEDRGATAAQLGLFPSRRMGALSAWLVVSGDSLGTLRTMSMSSPSSRPGNLTASTGLLQHGHTGLDVPCPLQDAAQTGLVATGQSRSHVVLGILADGAAPLCPCGHFCALQRAGER